MFRLVILTTFTLAGCPRGEAPASVDPPPARSADNEPIAVDLVGREVRVRCEVACDPLREELTRLERGCVADPLSPPHLVSAGGASLAGLGCCTAAEAAYRDACGLDGELSACGSAWLARCADDAS